MLAKRDDVVVVVVELLVVVDVVVDVVELVFDMVVVLVVTVVVLVELVVTVLVVLVEDVAVELEDVVVTVSPSSSTDKVVVLVPSDKASMTPGCLFGTTDSTSTANSSPGARIPGVLRA